MKKAIGIITREPNENILKFYSNFKEYDIYIIIDNNVKLFTELRNKYSNINFIKLNNEYSEKRGYMNSSSIYMGFSKVISWDKALLFFYDIKKYDYVWLIEDDVWFYDENVLINIDEKYPSSDLLTNKYNIQEKLTGWPWDKMKINLEKPYFKCIVNCCRFSKKMFEAVNNYVLKNKTLFYIEVSFPTLGIKNNLVCDCPLEMRTLSYDDVITIDKLNKKNLFHPIKKFNEHNNLRNKLT